MSTSQSVSLSRKAVTLRRAFDRDARWTKLQAADHLACTPRHVVRLIAELRNAGVPVSEERVGRSKLFFIPEEHQCRAIQIDELDEEALRALTVAAQASQALLRGTPLEEPLQRAFAVLLSAFGDEDMFSFDPDSEASHWYFDAAALPGAQLEVLRVLDSAIAESRSVRVDYVNGKSETSTNRKLDPLCFAPFKSGWQLAAYCHTRKAVRNFSPARISSIRACNGEPGGDFFSVPADFERDVHFGGRFGALQGSGRLQTVRLRVSPEVAQHFRTKPYHSSQHVEPELDGHLVVVYQVKELETMRSFVRSWGPNVVAIDPQELVAQLAQDAVTTAEMYAAVA